LHESVDGKDVNGLPGPESESETYLEAFIGFLKQREKEHSTVKMYECEIKSYLRHLAGENKQLKAVEPADIWAWRERMLQRGMKPSTINKSISILSSFFKWAKSMGHIALNPCERSRVLEGRKDAPRRLTPEEETRLLRLCADERSIFKRVRNEALIHVLLYAGLRVEEVSNLRLNSLRDSLLVVFDEDAEARIVPVDEATVRKLEAWIEVRTAEAARKREYEASPYLFVSERSGYFQPRSIQFVIEGYSGQMGASFVCQTLRHTYCYNLVKQGLPIEQVKARAGHKSVLSTHRYFERTADSFQAPILEEVCEFDSIGGRTETL